jgi:hypothetical protein
MVTSSGTRRPGSNSSMVNMSSLTGENSLQLLRLLRRRAEESMNTDSGHAMGGPWFKRSMFWFWALALPA